MTCLLSPAAPSRGVPFAGMGRQRPHDGQPMLAQGIGRRPTPAYVGVAAAAAELRSIPRERTPRRVVVSQHLVSPRQVLVLHGDFLENGRADIHHTFDVRRLLCRAFLRMLQIAIPAAMSHADCHPSRVVSQGPAGSSVGAELALAAPFCVARVKARARVDFPCVSLPRLVLPLRLPCVGLVRPRS